MVDADRDRGGILKFTLETRGYRVLGAESLQEAIAIFASAPIVDLVLTAIEPDGLEVISRLKRIYGWTPMILFFEGACPDIGLADAAVSRKTSSTQDLLERVRVMSKRKRGPRKEATPQFSTVST